MRGAAWGVSSVCYCKVSLHWNNSDNNFSEMITNSRTAGFESNRVTPGLRAKLSIRLFQAMKAIFLTVGEELRKPSSSRCSRELMKGPPLCNSCVEYGSLKFYTTDRTELHKGLSKWSEVLNTLQTARDPDSWDFLFLNMFSIKV